MLKMLVQVAAGSCDRMIYNEQTLEYVNTKQGSHPYPYPYGFIVGTSSEDGDCVDCYLLTKNKVAAGSIVECEAIGLLEQHEGDEIDHKVLAVLEGEDTDLDVVVVSKLQTFIIEIFSGYPELQVRVGPVHPRKAALQYLLKSSKS